VLLGTDIEVSAGAKARLSGKVLEVPVGPELVGRVVDPLGRPLDAAHRLKPPLPAVLSARLPAFWPVSRSMTADDLD